MIIHVPNTGSVRSTTEMEILENPLEWLRAFQEGWLANLDQSGAPDWNQYPHPQNFLTPNSRGIKLSQSRVLLITTAGVYHAGKQQPFQNNYPLGDYSIRTIPFNTPPEQLAFSHPKFNSKYVKEDYQVLLPLEHMRQLCNEGVIGGLVPMVVSFSGFMPHAIRLVKELVPAILQVAKEYNAHAAMIIPAGKLCIQSAGLVARALEVNNIATTMTTWDPDMAFLTAPPRLTSTYLPPSSPLGMPGNVTQQRKVLTATLQLLELNAPTGIVYLNESGAI